MIYVFDTNSFSALKHITPDSFPSFWERIGALVDEGNLRSVREVRREIKELHDGHIFDWANRNGSVFHTPCGAQTEFVSMIFAQPHFESMIGAKQRLRGSPVADPWVVAAAAVWDGCVVTEEALKPNAAKIPNVCAAFQVDCTNLDGFLQQNGWRF